MESKLNKTELKKMLSDLQSEVKVIQKKINHLRDENNKLRLNYKKTFDKIKTDINVLSQKKSLLMDNIGKLNSLISASKKI